MMSEEKDATKLILKRRPLENAKDLHLKSHFAGQPYFEKGEKWPETHDGIKLSFIFQIFNDGVIALPEHIKLLQFYCVYYGEDDFSYDTGSDCWLVKIYEELKEENAVIIKNPVNHSHYCEIEYEQITSSPDDDDFCSRLGGYPKWIQFAEIAVDDDITLLFQLDSEDEAGLMWSDMGMVYAFYDNKTKKVNIIMQYC